MTEDLHLFYPQWEGSGETNELYTGATILRKHLESDIPFTEVGIEPLHEIEVKYGIVGYAHIFRYLEEVQRLLTLKNPRRVFTLGGDCGIEAAPISFLNKQYNGDLAVVWLDAHADMNTPQSSPSQTFHGMVLRTLLGEGEPELVSALFSTLRPQQIFLAGVRDLDPAEERFIARKQIASFTCEQLTSQSDTILAAIKEQGFSHVYLHIDMDILDPLTFPYVKCPTPHGITFETLQRVRQTIMSNVSPVGWSIVELTPSREGEIGAIEHILSLYTYPF